MRREEVRKLIKWMLAWNQNAIIDYTCSTYDIHKISEHFLAGEDPWESAAAIFEKRNLLDKNQERM